MLLYFYIFCICYLPIVSIIIPQIGALDISIIWIFHYLMILVFVICFALKPNSRFINKWSIILAIFYTIFIASIGWAQQYTYQDASIIKVVFRNGLLPIVIVIISLYLFSEEKNIDVYVKNIAIVAGILSLIAIYQASTGILLNKENVRASATFLNANGLAIFLVMCLPCLMYGISKQAINRIFGWMLSVCIIGGIIATLSRKGIVTMFMMFAIYYLFSRQFKKLMITGTFVIILTVLFFQGLDIFPNRLTLRKFKSEMAYKEELAGVGWKMFMEKPFIGFGYKGYNETFSKYISHATIKRYDAHNMYITELANRGLLGFIPFLMIFLYPLFYSFNFLVNHNNDASSTVKKGMAVICISCTIPFMISGYFAGGLFYDVLILFVLYTHMSLVLAVNRKTVEVVSKPPSGPITVLE